MSSCDELLEDLEKFKSDKRNEYPLGPIEKWMIKELSVKRLKDTGGSAIRFEHPILEELKDDSTFVVHRKHAGVLVNSCVNSFFKQRAFRLIVFSV